MRELAAHLLLMTFGLHTSVLSSFPLQRPSARAEAPANGAGLRQTGQDGLLAETVPVTGPGPLASQRPSGAFDLASWSAEGAFGEEAWDLGRHSARTREVDGTAFLVTPNEFEHARFEGILHAPATPPNGGANGLVLGYRAPVSKDGDDPSSHEFLLVAWEPSAEGDEVQGEWTLSRVRPSHPQEVIARVAGSHEAFALDQPRPIAVDVSSDRIRLEVASEEVFDVPGSFRPGRFGFYTQRSGGTVFSGWRTENLTEPPPPTPRSGEAPDASAGMTLAKTKLWPADIAMANVGLEVVATDPSGEPPTVTVRVFADEPDDEDPADRNVWPDVKLDEAALHLRRERRTLGDGRVYLILAEAAGLTGSAHDCATVVVPRTNTTAGNAQVNAQAAAAVAHCDTSASAPSGYFLIAEGPYLAKEPYLGVRPLLECVVEHGPSQFTAVFGYRNDNPVPVEVTVGPDNKFNQAPLDRGQPDHFAAGRSPAAQGAFTIPFSGSNLTWSVRGPDRVRRNVTASSNSVRCTFTPATPVAVDDIASTTIDMPVVIPVLLNDSDPQGQSLDVMRVAPTNGAVDINADGTVTFTPQLGFFGTSVFTYVASDGAYGSDVARVTVSVSEGPVNQPPSVEAGEDQANALPANASLQGTVTDDGLPAGGSLTFAWTYDSGPGTVTFTPPDSVTTSATFSAPGAYVLRLTASDSLLSASDTLTVVAATPAMPSLAIGDVTVTEGHQALTSATGVVTLSAPSAVPVTVRYVTGDQTASSSCDYLPSAGELTIPSGATSATVTFAVVGDVAVEPDESLSVTLGDAIGATLADDEAIITIANDDAPNAPPSTPVDRAPTNGATGELNPTLLWSASDPEGQATTHDVYVGTSLDLTGQEWQRHCPASSTPGGRFGAASAYDDANDRLIVFGGQMAVGDVGDLWVLENATGLGGASRWVPLAASGGPGPRQRASAVYLGASNRLFLFGGCVQDCTSVLADAWVLSNANGLGGAPVWTSLPNMPGPRYGQGAALDSGIGEVMAFGGSNGVEVRADFWVLSNLVGPGDPTWVDLTTAGPSPREGASAAFDPLGRRFYVFGGRDAAGVVKDDVWALQDPDATSIPWWFQVSAEGSLPAGRWGHGAAYDEGARRMVVYQGTGAGLESGSNIALRDVFVLEEVNAFSGLHRWSRLEPLGPPAPGRFLAATGYSPSRARVVVSGGRDNRAASQWLDDLWTLSDPIGRVPLASASQTASSFVAPTPDQGATYYWRVVTRDVHGATSGSPLWRFLPNAPPIVELPPEIQVAFPANLALTGVVLDDGRPEPSSLATLWSANGDPRVFISSPGTTSTTVTFDEPGEYMLTLTADDGAIASEASTFVYVSPGQPNEPPSVSAGADLAAPQTGAPLHGLVNDDGFPQGVVTASWSQVTGPGVATFDDPLSPITSVRFSETGTYVLALTASDGALSASDEVMLIVSEPADLAVSVPDLSEFVVDGHTLAASGILATAVTNEGDGPASLPFTVSFFEDRNANGEPDGADAILALVPVAALGPGESVIVSGPAAGQVLFAGNIVHAMVDSGRVVVESDETNNITQSLACESAPGPQPFAAALKWSWTNSTILAGVTAIESVPAVGDLDRDGRPEIVVVTHSGSSTGVLRVISGQDGHDVMTVDDPVLRLQQNSQVALGNIDSDPQIEIIGVLAGSTRLAAFEHDGTLKWLGAPIENVQYGGASLADLDADGIPEIVIGRQVLNADGSLRWTGSASSGTAYARLSVVADLDLDGSPEVLSGRSAYRANGTLYWQSAAANDGYNALGNFDADEFPEIVVVANGTVRVLEHTGILKWGPVALQGGGAGGPPTVADFDGDGAPEIGVAGTSRYVVVDGDGSVLWTRPIVDVSSNQTGSSVFDFEGDGRAEVIYSDEDNLWVFSGLDGTVLFQSPMGSQTSIEYPVVADVDADGSADIVAPGGFGAHRGLHVFEALGTPWVPTRRIWNQHTYHISNVNEDGTIPPHEQPGWLKYNSYRQNRLTQGCEFARPDLEPSFVRRTDGPDGVTVTVRIGNGGGRPAPAGLSVTFHNGEPGAVAPIATLVTTASIEAAAFADVTVTLAPSAVAIPLWVVADAANVVVESDETNNRHQSRVFLNAPPNDAPVVSAGPDQRLVHPQIVATLDGAASDDGQPLDDLRVTWGAVSGPSGVSFANVHALDTAATFGAPGTYVLRLSADDHALQAMDEVTIVVEPPNQPPSVDVGPDHTTTLPLTALDATVIDDGLPSGGMPTYQWTVISGPPGVSFSTPNAVDTSVTVSVPGTYVLRLTASDSALVAFDDLLLDVPTFANQAPTVSAGPDRVLVLPENTLTLEGLATDDGLPAGSTLSLRWVALSGAGEVLFESPYSLQTVASLPNPGAYVLRLHATDGELTAYDDLTVVVQPASPTGPAPTAVLTSPVPGTRITAPVDVIGSALSSSLASWQLEHRLKDDGAWTRFATGTTEVTNGVLGRLDTTLLLNGITEVRLTVTDTAGRLTSAATLVVVKEQQKVGNFTVSFVDLEVPLAGLPIRVMRSYDSRDKRPGDFGKGWRLELSDVRVEESETAGLAWQSTVSPGFFPTYCLASARPPMVAVTLPDGRVLEFQMTLIPTCQPFAPIDFVRVSFVPFGTTLGTLTAVDGADAYVLASWPGQAELYGGSGLSILDPTQYRYTAPDGRVYLVHDTDGLKSLADLNGNVLTVSPSGISHSSGKGISFTRDDDGRIAVVTDPSGEAIAYTYDSNGDLISHTDREFNTTRYGYHVAIPHHLVSIEDPLGRRPIRNEYDDAGRLVRHIDAFGKTIEYTHQIGIRREIVTDRNLKQRVLDYDERGNVVQETDPLGKVVLRTYDARNNRLTETLPHEPGTSNPPITTYTYDGADNVLSVTDAEANRTVYTYNTRKQVLTVKDAREHFTTNTYDAKGNLVSTRVSATAGGPALTEMAYTYDAKGNLRTQTVVVEGVPQTTTYGHDASGNLTQERDASGHLTTYAYDSNGNQTRKVTTRTLSSGESETLEARYEHDRNGRLLKTIDPDETSMRSVYDPLGRQVESYDKLDHRTSSLYDEMGRLTRTTFADAMFEESTYDNEGRRLSFRDRRGQVTMYEYDDVGRLKRTTFPDTTFTENTYDAAGRLTAVRDARGKTTTYEYDRVGRRTKITVPLTTGVSAETLVTYDANGNQLTVRDPLLRTTTFEYDEMNRRKKTIFDDTTFTETTYDELGRRTSERDQAERVTSFGYDALGRLVRVTDARGKTTRYEYDEVGNLISRQDANGRRTRFEHDRLGRETKRTLPAVESVEVYETKSYDDAGNLESRADFAGRVTTYAHDVMNRLLLRTAQCPTSPCAGAADASFTYTSSGRRKTATDARGVTSYVYDDRDRLESLTYPDSRKLEYLYDGNGNRTTLNATIPAVGGGSATVLTTTYTYDDANRLDLVTDTAGRVYDHGYDANGNRTSLAQPNGTSTSYVYNTLNRLTNLSTGHAGLGTTVQSYVLTLGPAGNREQIDEADGTSRIYAYDELYRLTSDTVTISGPNQYAKGFTYDDVGNRLSQTTSIGPAGWPGPVLQAGTLAYDYDERDRLTAETLDTNPPTAYGWDDDGNLVTKSGEATYAWDRENRLIRVNKADGTIVEHAYDADGVRVQTITTPAGGSPATTHFLVDPSGSLSHVVAETDAGGSLVVHYVRGDDLLSLMRPLVAAPSSPTDWQTRYYHSDHIGSVRRLTNEAGQITDGYTYTAFGELLAHTGSDPQPYAFTGEPYDPRVGFQYHRARWMDSRVGRFVGMDPWQGLEHEPASLHKYLYAANDPINNLDPTGHRTLSESLTALLVVTILFTLRHPGLTAAIGTVGAALIPEEVQNAMLASGIPGVTPIGAVGRAEARGVSLLKNWASRFFAARELGRLSGGIGEAFELFAKRHLFKESRGPIPVGAGRHSIDLLWDRFLVELKTSRRLEPDDLRQLAAGAQHATQNGLELTYVFLSRPTRGTIETIHEAGGRVFYIFP